MPELEHVIEEVKKFLKDVGDYLSITLKKEKLQKETNFKREKLLKDVESILDKLSPPLIEEDDEEQEEYVDVDLPMSPNSEHIQEEGELEELYEDTVPAESTHSNDSSHNSEEEQEDNKIGTIDLDGDPYGDVKVNPIAASDLTSPSKEGFLDKKRKGQFGLQGWQKRYCIIKANVLYYYKRKTDKEQCNQIVLTGYQGREAPEYEKKNKRKDCLFEVVCPAKRSYQFIAQNKKEMHDWIKAIAFASKLAPSSIDPLAKSTPNNSGGSEEMLDYDDTSIPVINNNEADDDDGYGETYEELDNYQSAKTGILPPPEIPVTNIEEEEPEPIDEDIYEDVSGQSSDPLPPPVTVPSRPAKSAANLPLPPEPTAPPPVPTTHRPPPTLPVVEKQPVTPVTPVTPYSPHTQIKAYQGKNEKNLKNDTKSSVKGGGKPPPPIPNRAETTSLPKRELWEEDYENIYIGLWDCMADDKDELEFKRGEMVHIISKEYDTFSWWIGERNNKVGLVPKDYLMKAYMI
ncbi:src kinase-associated phosphoprotein 2-like isoform X2 [Asterias amurensis]|uniref:src kinase-associated phosphoprotein 2-like isoform X2 n=1 Tax=Asterias amurensis TaxID=7602 RepID=UPI003AB6D633